MMSDHRPQRDSFSIGRNKNDTLPLTPDTASLQKPLVVAVANQYSDHPPQPPLRLPSHSHFSTDHLDCKFFHKLLFGGK